jgi:acyl-CoA thioesterase I
VASCSRAPAARGGWPIRNSPPRAGPVIALGDSLTAGYHTGPGESYPDQLAAQIQRPVLNLGVTGETAAQTAERVDPDVLPLKPAVVLVWVGANDVLRGLPPEPHLAAVRRIVLRLEEDGALVLLLGLEGYTPGRPFDYSGAYQAVARETGCVYVPAVLDGVLGTSTMMRDRIHPSPAGNARIARRLARELRPYLAGG